MSPTRRAWAAASTLFLLGCVGSGACAAIVGIDEPSPRDDASATDAGRIDGAADRDAEGRSDANARRDAAGDGEGADRDAPPVLDGSVAREAGAKPSDGGVDGATACSARTTLDANGLFVTPTGMDGLACGSRESPCATIQATLAQASTLGKTLVYVASGTYVESLTLVPGVSIEGGWTVSGSKWTPQCPEDGGASATILQAPSSAVVTVLADSLNGSASLTLLQIQSKAASDVEPGESLYGVLASGATTSLSLDQVWIQVSGGGAGVPGGTGSSGTSALDAGCAPEGGAATGAAGPLGASSDGGQFSSTGYAPGAGMTGGPGVAGAAGSSGGSPTCSTTCVSCDSSHCTPFGQDSVCGATGLSGCGGGGGGGGAGGGGGGSGIALYAWDAQVTVTGSVLVAGPGGAGAAGGPGAGGGAPSGGATGAGGSCLTGCTFAETDAGLVCTGTTQNEPGGTAGGAGHGGGTGGAGGGGAGGWSCGYFVGGQGTVSEVGSTVQFAGAGGGGPPSAASGLAAAKCPP